MIARSRHNLVNGITFLVTYSYFVYVRIPVTPLDSVRLDVHSQFPPAMWTISTFGPVLPVPPMDFPTVNHCLHTPVFLYDPLASTQPLLNMHVFALACVDRCAIITPYTPSYAHLSAVTPGAFIDLPYAKCTLSHAYTSYKCTSLSLRILLLGYGSERMSNARFHFLFWDTYSPCYS